MSITNPKTNAEETPLFRIGNLLLLEHLESVGRVSRVSGFLTSLEEGFAELSYMDPNKKISRFELANPFTDIDTFEPYCFGAFFGMNNILFKINGEVNTFYKHLDYFKNITTVKKNSKMLNPSEEVDKEDINIGDLVVLGSRKVDISGFVTDKTDTHLYLSHFDPNSFLSKREIVKKFTKEYQSQKDMKYRISRFGNIYRLIDAYKTVQDNFDRPT